MAERERPPAGHPGPALACAVPPAVLFVALIGGALIGGAKARGPWPRPAAARVLRC
jgi:hypothetical protein